MNNLFKHTQLAKAFEAKKSPIYIACADIEKASGIRVAPDTFRAHLDGRTVPNANHLNAYKIYFKKSHAYFYKEKTHAKNKPPKSGRKQHT